MSESVKILIAADDKASSAFQNVANNAELMSRRVRESGQKTKASLELSGTIAKALGGTALGAFSSELAQLTERVSAFSEVSKAGALGAAAFQAGLVAAAGVATYKIADGIARWAYDLDEVERKAADAEKAFTAMAAAMDKARSARTARDKEDFGLIRDPAEREAAIQARVDALDKQAADLAKRKHENMTQLAEAQRALGEGFQNPFLLDAANTKKGDVANAQAQLDKTIELQQAIKKEADELRSLVSARTKSIEARKAENAAADRSASFIQSLRQEVEVLNAKTDAERRAIEAGRNATPAQRGEALRLLEERDAIKAKLEEERKLQHERELAARKEEDAQKRIADLEKQRRVDAEARRIEMIKGKEAAQAYRYEQDGLSRATAQQLAAEEEKLRQLERSNKARPESGPLPAVQGRLLTMGISGGSVDPMQQVAQNSQKQIAQLQQLNTNLGAKLDKLLYEQQKAKGVILKTVTVP